jgi:hypothetical protein
MPKKLLFVTMLLILVSVQALAASCDVRCSLMGTSTHTHGHAWHADERKSHCSGMSMESDKGASLSASDSCAATTCGTELKAINKGSDQNDSDSSRLLMSAVALLVDPFGNSGLNITTSFAALSRGSDGRPLAQRPGSSLRI